MMLDVARALVAWFEHGTYGVRALLAGSSIPRDVGDPLPVITTITDEFSDDRAALGRLPLEASLPALVVDVAAVSVVEGQVVSDRGEGQIVARVRYGIKTARLSEGKTAGSYVMRAVAQSLRLLNKEANTSARQRNGVHFRPAVNGAIEVRPYLETVGDDLVTGLCIVTYDLRDVSTLP